MEYYLTVKIFNISRILASRIMALFSWRVFPSKLLIFLPKSESTFNNIRITMDNRKNLYGCKKLWSGLAGLLRCSCRHVSWL